MNLKAKKFRIAPCVVCGYKFSDMHHLFPQSRQRGKGPILALCPNHHRYAGMVQAMLEGGVGRSDISAFAVQHFDDPFNTTILSLLMDAQIDEVMHEFFQGLFGGIL